MAGKKKHTARRKKKVTRKQIVRKRMKLGMYLLSAIFIIMIGMKVLKKGPFNESYKEFSGTQIDAVQPDIDVELLTVNPYSRPGTATNEIKGIVIHYTANPGSSAINNRDYFEGLKDSHATQASSNFVVGLDGEIVQCVPTWEMAYASNSRNIDTVSIECCHPDETGRFNDATYRSMVQLTSWLCLKFGLDEESVIRHYDVTGKNCPKYFVENEDAWNMFKQEVKLAIENAK